LLTIPQLEETMQWYQIGKVISSLSSFAENFAEILSNFFGFSPDEADCLFFGIPLRFTVG